jgi:hypothetical protein
MVVGKVATAAGSYAGSGETDSQNLQIRSQKDDQLFQPPPHPTPKWYEGSHWVINFVGRSTEAKT